MMNKNDDTTQNDDMIKHIMYNYIVYSQWNILNVDINDRGTD